jgi:hypothetical protein
VDSTKRLSASSPAVNRGVVIPNFNDSNSAWPYSGSAPDLGANEVGAATSGPAPPANVRIAGL